MPDEALPPAESTSGALFWRFAHCGDALERCANTCCQQSFACRRARHVKSLPLSLCLSHSEGDKFHPYSTRLQKLLRKSRGAAAHVDSEGQPGECASAMPKRLESLLARDAALARPRGYTCVRAKKNRRLPNMRRARKRVRHRRVLSRLVDSLRGDRASRAARFPTAGRAERSVIPPARARVARHVAVLAGTNDLRFGAPAEVIEANLRALIAVVHSQGLWVGVSSGGVSARRVVSRRFGEPCSSRRHQTSSS